MVGRFGWSRADSCFCRGGFPHSGRWDADGTSKAWQSVGIESLAIRIGLHSGQVVAGNIGSQARIKYAVIGDTVNTASRVEGLNKILETSLLLTAATRTKAKHENIVFEDLGLHAVKGRTEPVHVYTTANARLRDKH